MLLLDTCTLLWLAADQDKLTSGARELLSRRRDRLFVSAISAFEIGIKHRKGKLTLPREPVAWFEGERRFHGLIEIPVDSRIAATSTQLPPLHRDPCDRIIVATAHIHGLTILSPDPLIKAYREADTAW